MSGNLTDKLPNNNDSLTTVMRVVKDLTAKVEALDEKVELRLYDIKPMWEQVLKTVLEVKEGQQRLEEGHKRLEQGHERLEQGHKRLEQGHERLEQGHQRLEQGHERLEQGYERLEQGQIFLQQEFEHLAKGQESLRRESHEIKTFCRDILRRLSIFNDTLVTIQSDYRDIYDRVRQIEQSNKEPSPTDLEPC